jgi:hypothetical protein
MNSHPRPSQEIAEAMLARLMPRYPQPVPVLDDDGEPERCDGCHDVATVEDFDVFGFRLPLCASCSTYNPREDVVSFALLVLP